MKVRTVQDTSERMGLGQRADYAVVIKPYRLVSHLLQWDLVVSKVQSADMQQDDLLQKIEDMMRLRTIAAAANKPGGSSTA